MNDIRSIGRLLIAALVALVLLAAGLRSAQATHDSFCYLVADAGGGPPGDDLLTQVDTTDFDPATNETSIGTGPGTTSIETISFQPGPAPGIPGPLFAANSGQLGTLNLTTGAFTATASTFGTGNGAQGSITFGDVDGLAFDSLTGNLFGAHRRGADEADDLLIQIDPATGAHIPDAFGAGVDYVVIGSFSVVGLADIDDLASDPADGQLYGVANNGGSGDRLVRIDASTGAVTDVGSLGVADMEGLSFDDAGQLWGTTGNASPAGERNRLYEINKSSGAASNPRALDNGSDYESFACHTTLAATPTPTATDTSTATSTATATPTATDTPAATATSSPTPSATATPQIVDPKSDSLFADNDGNGIPSPGDVLQYLITISNVGGAPAEGVAFSDTPDSNTPLLVGSVSTSQGTVTTGNSAGDTTVAVDVGTIAAGDTVTITFRVTIADPLPPGVSSVANQGIVSGSNFSSSPTDDPDTGAPGDPTVTAIGQGVSELPATGFVPGRLSAPAASSSRAAYRKLAEIWLEIPDLAVRVPIVGVPAQPGGWDVSGLWNQAGYLEGTAFPTWAGNTAITGHVYLSDGSPGPFVRLGELRWGDELAIHAFGQRYTYAVRQSMSVVPGDLSALRHEEYDWVTLITCQGYDERQGTYRWRRVVRAVLVEVSQP